MTIRFTCHDCGREYSVAEKHAGRKFTCKSCGERLVVPELRVARKRAKRATAEPSEQRQQPERAAPPEPAPLPVPPREPLSSAERQRAKRLGRENQTPRRLPAPPKSPARNTSQKGSENDFAAVAAHCAWIIGLCTLIVNVFISSLPPPKGTDIPLETVRVFITCISVGLFCFIIGVVVGFSRMIAGGEGGTLLQLPFALLTGIFLGFSVIRHRVPEPQPGNDSESPFVQALWICGVGGFLIGFAIGAMNGIGFSRKPNL